MLEFFPCYWASRKRRAEAFSLRKTPIDAELLHDTYRENALAFPTGAGGNNSRANEHSNEDCAKNEIVRHKGSPFGACCAALEPGRELLEQSKDVLSWYTEPFHLLGSYATKVDATKVDGPKVLFRLRTSRVDPLFQETNLSETSSITLTRDMTFPHIARKGNSYER